jgi:hypothetical protein
MTGFAKRQAAEKKVIKSLWESYVIPAKDSSFVDTSLLTSSVKNDSVKNVGSSTAKPSIPVIHLFL